MLKNYWILDICDLLSLKSKYISIYHMNFSYLLFVNYFGFI